MLRDIETRDDIVELLTEFYKIIIDDDEIGHHFDDLDLEHHLPIITAFWEKVLFDRPVYFGNPLLVHQKLNEKSRLQPAHFGRWVRVFRETVEKLFEGETAEIAKQKAELIGHSLSQRLNGDVAV